MSEKTDSNPAKGVFAIIEAIQIVFDRFFDRNVKFAPKLLIIAAVAYLFLPDISLLWSWIPCCGGPVSNIIDDVTLLYVAVLLFINWTNPKVVVSRI